MITIEETMFRSRRAVRLHNQELELVILPGGGHIASLRLADLDLNPLWEPPWKGMEPEDYHPLQHADYGPVEGRLLASLAGHNLCLDHFGWLSDAEARAGGDFHGEAPNRTWDVLDITAEAGSGSLLYGLELPEAGLQFRRTLKLLSGEPVVYFEEKISNLRRRDCPLEYQQHVTLGPPFVEGGITRLDLPGRRARTYPNSLGGADSLQLDTDFDWPRAPGINGDQVRVDRFPDENPSYACYTVLLDAPRGLGFVAAANPAAGLLVLYLFPQSRFPWVAVWEENRGTTDSPYLGHTIAWGLEFGTTPLPVSRMENLAAGPLFGHPRFLILDAQARITTRYLALLQRIPPDWAGVQSIDVKAGELTIVESGRARRLQIRTQLADRYLGLAQK